MVLTLLMPPDLMATLGPLQGQLFMEWLDWVALYISAWEVWQVGCGTITHGKCLTMEHYPQCGSLVVDPGVMSQHACVMYHHV